MNGTQLEIAWAEWKAEALNRLFQKQGVTKRRGRITAETVRHGENRLPIQNLYAPEDRKPSGPKAG